MIRFTASVIRLVVAIALVALLTAKLGHAAPPPRHAYPARRVVFWVCPMKPNGDPVTRPAGVCFRDFAP